MGEKDATPPTAFGALLRRYRLAAGLTQESLAERAILGIRSIQDLEAGTHRPRHETVQQLVRALGLAGDQRTQFEAAGQPAPRQRTEVASASATVAPPPGRARRTNLPIAWTSFVGRDRELVEVRQLLATAPLLTLVGVGGCGKTRLAVELGHLVIDAYPDGVWLVDLAPLADPQLVPFAVATVLGVEAGPADTILAGLAAVLASRRLLLVLDNCEHLIQACARLAEVLLQHCPSVRILATSREALGIAGEVRWPVPPLAVPPEGMTLSLAGVMPYAAVRLFLERASGVLPAFRPREPEAVGEICRRLDGLPLAIELAASLVAALPVEQIAARLDRRFQLLRGGSRAALPRHQTLAALLDWSYDLLSEPERILFNRLAVFAGSFTLEAAEAIGAAGAITADAVVPLLVRLVATSLVVAEPGADGRARYRLLETLRQFGWERLEAAGEAPEGRQRHGHYYLALAEAADREIHGRDQIDWLRQLDRDHDNLRAALAWLETSGQITAALQLAGALAFFWNVRGHYAEGRGHLARLLARPEATEGSAERARALWGMGILAGRQGYFEEARSFFQQGWELATSASLRLTIAVFRIDSVFWEISVETLVRARAELTEVLTQARELGDRWCVARALSQLARMARCQREDAVAHGHAEEALAICHQTGDLWSAGWVLDSLGDDALIRGDHRAARAYFGEWLDFARALEDRSSIANALHKLGLIDFDQGAPMAAGDRFEEALALYRDRGDKLGVIFATSGLCEVALAVGETRQAHSLAQEKLAVARQLGISDFCVLGLTTVGNVALAEGDDAAARSAYAQGLGLLGEPADAWIAVGCLEGFARVAAARNQADRALRLAGQAAAIRAANAIRIPFLDVERVGIGTVSLDRERLDRALDPIRADAGGLSPEDQAKAWAKGQAMTLEQAIAYALEDEVG